MRLALATKAQWLPLFSNVAASAPSLAQSLPQSNTWALTTCTNVKMPSECYLYQPTSLQSSFPVASSPDPWQLASVVWERHRSISGTSNHLAQSIWERGRKLAWRVFVRAGLIRVWSASREKREQRTARFHACCQLRRVGVPMVWEEPSSPPPPPKKHFTFSVKSILQDWQ